MSHKPPNDKPKPPTPAKPKANVERLNRYIAACTGISRRKVDVLIANGDVVVNGKVAQVGQSIVPGKDKISLSGETVVPQRIEVILFHKPKGVLSTRHDPEGRKTIYDLLPKQYYNLDSAGRLDRNSTGLMLLSNDGNLIQRLTHPSFDHKKQYRVKVNKTLTEGALAKLQEGVTLYPENKQARCQVKSVTDTKTVVLVLKTGLNRQIRRMFEALGYEVTDIKRTAFAGLILGDLAPGAWRKLTPREFRQLTGSDNPQSKSQTTSTQGARPNTRGTSRPGRPAPQSTRKSSSTGRPKRNTPPGSFSK